MDSTYPTFDKFLTTNLIDYKFQVSFCLDTTCEFSPSKSTPVSNKNLFYFKIKL